MTKVIDFQDAKSENNRTKPQGLADYIKKQERLMDLITTTAFKKIHEMHASKIITGQNKKMEEVNFLIKKLNDLHKKVSNSGIGEEDKERLIEKIEQKMEHIKSMNEACLKIMELELKHNENKEKKKKLKEGSKRKAIRRRGFAK